MPTNRWSEMDHYIHDHLLAASKTEFDTVIQANAAAGLRAIDVPAVQGKFLNLLVTISGARRVLEIGTLGGYSAIWMAKALPEDGKLITLEYEPHHADVARANFARAGIAGRIEVIVGAALDTLPQLQARGKAAFDLIFIDADKPNNVGYLRWALALSRPGTIIVLDNVVRNGQVLDATSTDPNVLGSRAAFAFLQNEPRIDATALQLVGTKGWDGFAMGVVKG